MPVIKVIDRKRVENTRPALNTFSQVVGSQVSIDTTNPPSSTYQRMRITRSIWGARRELTDGGVGGSTDDSGSLVRSSRRRPGTNSRAATSTMKGNDVNMADDHTLLTAGSPGAWWGARPSALRPMG